MHVSTTVDQFVRAVLGTGLMLAELVADLAEELPADAYPGEEPVDVVFEMACATIATALTAVDQGDVRWATELIDLSRARTLAHLRLTCELSRRIHGDEDAARLYG